MLVALQIQERHPRGWRQKIWERFRRAGEVRSHFVSVPGGRYIQIVAECDRHGRVDWREIRRVAGSEASRLLLPEGICPPENSGVSSFSGQALRQELMRQTALQLLRTVPALPRQTVVVYDPQGRHPSLADDLISLAADIRIVTARPAAYEEARERAMAQHGACLPVTDDTACIGGAALVLAPDGIGPDVPSPRGWILSGADGIRPHTITGYIPAVCEAYMDTLPPGCDIWDYLAGLYELSAIRSIGAHPPLALCAGAQHLSLGDIGWRLAGLDISISV